MEQNINKDLTNKPNKLSSRNLTEAEKKEREYKKGIFIKFFNSDDGKVVIDILENMISKNTNFDNPNINYFRDGQLSVIEYIKKNAIK